MNEKIIQTILEDLYRVDASLKEHEEELIGVITQLIKAKPESELNETFRMELREQILKMARDIKLNTNFGKTKFSWADSFMPQLLKPAGLVAAGLVLGIIIALPIMLKQGGGVEQLKSNFAFEVQKEGDGAFGSLVSEEQVVAQSGDTEAVGKGGGSSILAPSITPMPIMEVSSLDARVVEPSIMPVPPMQRVNYNYVYTGDDFTIDNDMMAVFQKTQDEKTASSVGKYITSIDIGVLDLSLLKNARVEQLRILEDRPDGYSISVNFTEGSVSFNQNWKKWTVDSFKKLKKSDLPEDSTIIAVTDKFIMDYKIDLSNYGKAEVTNDWIQDYDIDGMSEFAPSYITVVYPLLIDGNQVYEKSGYPTGIQISVNIKKMKVTGLWNLNSQSYKSSLYEVETDVEKILEVAREGERRYYFDNSTKTLEFELGTPTQVLAKIYNYENGESKQLLVPALVFPVTKIPDEKGYYQKNIIVLLVKELLGNKAVQIYGEPPIRITPIILEQDIEIQSEIPIPSPEF